MRASKQRRVPSALVRPALWFCACNLLAAALSAQCTNVSQVPNQTISSGTSCYSNNDTLTAAGVTINGSASVSFVAGHTVHLTPGFHATAGTAGTTFHAWAETAPSVISVFPSSGTGFSQPFTWTVSSPSGYGNLAELQAIFNTSLSGANACYIRYSRASNLLYLADSSASFSWMSGIVPGSSAAAGNGYCSILGSGSSVSSSGSQLAVTVAVTFQTYFAGTKNEYLIADDNEGLNTTWQQMGTWTIGNSGGFTPIRIDSGASAARTDSLGQVWSADYGSSSGSSPFTTGAGISGTPDQALYQTERYSYPDPLTYQFGVPNGNYTVTLKFAEIYSTGPGQRSMNVTLNGTTVITNLDLYVAAGGANRAYDLSYPVSVTNGQLTIVLSSNLTTNSAEVNAIQIVAGTAPQQYSLTTSVPSGGGSTSPSCPSGCLYNSGAQVQITAIPANGYQFSGFSGVDSSNGSTGYVTMNANRSVTANFTQTITSYSLTTNVSPSGSGTLTFSPACCTYNAGTQVTITAAPASGYQFSGWTGVDSYNGTIGYVTMNGNRSVTANFTTVVTQYQLTNGVSPAGAGSVSPSCPSGCSVSSPVTITALPNAGYAFTSFSGTQSSSSNPASFAMTSAITETANFTAQVPAISGMSPSWGPANTPVTISGAGWGATAGASTVKFNGVTATISSWSATAIVAQVPSGANSGAITVNVAGFASAASPSSFTVSDSPPPGPTIESLSLPQGPPQVGFIIAGSGFGATQGTSTVTLNGSPLTVVSSNGSRLWSDTSIIAQVPAGTAQTPVGQAWMVVVTVSGVVSTGKPFSVTGTFGCNF